MTHPMTDLDPKGLEAAHTDWVLVPREPTKAMADAYWAATGESEAMRGRTQSYGMRYYRAMIAASPTQPVEAEPVAWVSPGQFAAHCDPLDSELPGGNYLPVRRTSAGEFTQPLYSAASTTQPAKTELAKEPEAIIRDLVLWINTKARHLPEKDRSGIQDYIRRMGIQGSIFRSALSPVQQEGGKP